MNKQGTDQSVQMQMMICAMHNSKAKTRFAHDEALACGVFCEFVTFPLVSWVRCGT